MRQPGYHIDIDIQSLSLDRKRVPALPADHCIHFSANNHPYGPQPLILSCDHFMALNLSMKNA